MLTNERNFPPNIRVIGESTRSVYSCPCLYLIPSSVRRIIGAPGSLDSPHQSGLTEIPRVLLLQVQHWQSGDH